jgi:hypothetical protein
MHALLLVLAANKPQAYAAAAAPMLCSQVSLHHSCLLQASLYKIIGAFEEESFAGGQTVRQVYQGCPVYICSCSEVHVSALEHCESGVVASCIIVCVVVDHVCV